MEKPPKMCMLTSWQDVFVLLGENFYLVTAETF